MMTSQVSNSNTALTNTALTNTALTNTALYPVLCSRNAHPRDSNIKFQEEGHKYTILDGTCSSSSSSSYTSVTTWNHSHFPHFDANSIIKKMMGGKAWKIGHKYWGLTADEIKDRWNANRDNAAGAGTALHYEIECFMNSKILKCDYSHLELLQNFKIISKYDKKYSNLVDGKSALGDLRDNGLLGIEWSYFLKFVEDFPEMKPYRTEWTIYHEELRLAGSIDMVYENKDGTLSIYDWKRAADITRVNAWNKCAITPCINWIADSNFWHYALQLNTYKAILELKYDKIVRDLYLVRLHPDCEDATYELIKVPDLKYEMIDLFEERKKMFL
jgi:hypothetical protein